MSNFCVIHFYIILNNGFQFFYEDELLQFIIKTYSYTYYIFYNRYVLFSHMIDT